MTVQSINRKVKRKDENRERLGPQLHTTLRAGCDDGVWLHVLGETEIYRENKNKKRARERERLSGRERERETEAERERETVTHTTRE